MGVELVALNGDDGEPNIRSEWINGVQWWVLADIAAWLGYRASDLARMVDREDLNTHAVRVDGGRPSIMVNRSGIFAILITATPRSAERKARLKAYRRWVTSEVLPEIHETGSYTHPGASQVAVPEPTRKPTSMEILHEITAGMVALERAQGEDRKRQVILDDRQTATELEIFDHQHRLEGLEGAQDWPAARVWAKRRGFRQNDETTLNRLSHRAGKIARNAGLQPAKIPHPLHTHVNGWPMWAWDQAAYELWGWSPGEDALPLQG